MPCLSATRGPGEPWMSRHRITVSDCSAAATQPNLLREEHNWSIRTKAEILYILLQSHHHEITDDRCSSGTVSRQPGVTYRRYLSSKYSYVHAARSAHRGVIYKYIQLLMSFGYRHRKQL